MSTQYIWNPPVQREVPLAGTRRYALHVTRARAPRAAQARDSFRGAISRVGHFATRLVAPLRRWLTERARYAELMSLDRRTLKDIGISRSDVRAIVHGTWDCAQKLDACPPTVQLVVDNPDSLGDAGNAQRAAA